MRRVWAGLALAAASLSADPSARGAEITLYSLHAHGRTSASPTSDPRVAPFLDLRSNSDFADVVSIGRSVLWESGDTGVAEFALDSDPDFGPFVQKLTNGIDDHLGVLILLPGSGANGRGALESAFQLGQPDLAGNRIDLIRLTVHKLSLTPWNDGTTAEFDLTWDIIGAPIPEPSSLVLLAVGAMALVATRRKHRTAA